VIRLGLFGCRPCDHRDEFSTLTRLLTHILHKEIQIMALAEDLAAAVKAVEDGQKALEARIAALPAGVDPAVVTKAVADLAALKAEQDKTAAPAA